MIISREWAMPNSNTFDIAPIKKMIARYIKNIEKSIDPFANKSKIAKVTNDLNPEMDTDYHLDALDFLKLFPDQSIDFIFYDPPYSLRQVSECYKNVGVEVTQEMTRSDWRTKQLNEASRIIKSGGLIMCFGWNSSGCGIKRNFELLEILLVAHGGCRNDTICTVERKGKDLWNE
jgi:hypothetical protein